MKKLFILIIICCVICTLFVGCQKEEPVVTYTVTFIQPGNMATAERVIAKITCEANSVIGNKAPEAGKYPFKKFKGWYTEKELLTQWNLYSDEVKSDMTLYPLYEMI